MTKIIELGDSDTLFSACERADQYLMIAANDEEVTVTINIDDADYALLSQMYSALGAMKLVFEQAFASQIGFGE